MTAIIAAAAAAAPGAAFAGIDMEYHTYGGFDAVANAFNKCALIFSGHHYTSLFGVIMVASLLSYICKALFGGASPSSAGSNILYSAFVPWFISMAFFTAAVLPKATVWLYDDVENKNQAIGGIPQIVVLAAGITNKIEWGLVQMVATAGDPVGFQSQAGGKGFLGLFDITSQPLTSLDSGLDTSLFNYSKDCVTGELTRPGSTLSVDELRKTSTDLIASLEKAVNPSNFTVVVDMSLSPSGEPMTCTDAWNNIKPRILADDNFKGNLTAACSEMGYDATNPASFSQCTTQIQGIVQNLVDPSKVTMDFVRQAYIAQNLEKVLADGTAYASFQMMAKSSGTMKTLNEWQPIVRATTIAITVCVTPFLLLLIPTPYFKQAMKYLIGSFAFIALWGIIDAVMHQFIIDYANRVYEQIRQNHMGMDALYFLPDTTEKILSQFGTMRTLGATLAMGLVTGLFGLMSMTGTLAASGAGEAASAGAGAAAQLETPAGRAQVIQGNVSALPALAMANEHGYMSRMAATRNQMEQQFGTGLGMGDWRTAGERGFDDSAGATEGYGKVTDAVGREGYRELVANSGIGRNVHYGGQGGAALRKGIRESTALNTFAGGKALEATQIESGLHGGDAQLAARWDYSDKVADREVFGTPENKAKFLEMSKGMSLAQQQGLVAAAQDAGYDPRDAQRLESYMGQMEKSGALNAFRTGEISNADLQSIGRIAKLDQAGHADAVEKMQAITGMGAREAKAYMETYQGQLAYAKYEEMEKFAEKHGHSFMDLARDSQRTFSLNLGEKEAKSWGLAGAGHYEVSVGKDGGFVFSSQKGGREYQTGVFGQKGRHETSYNLTESRTGFRGEHGSSNVKLDVKKSVFDHRNESRIGSDTISGDRVDITAPDGTHTQGVGVVNKHTDKFVLTDGQVSQVITTQRVENTGGGEAVVTRQGDKYQQTVAVRADGGKHVDMTQEYRFGNAGAVNVGNVNVVKSTDGWKYGDALDPGSASKNLAIGGRSLEVAAQKVGQVGTLVRAPLSGKEVAGEKSGYGWNNPDILHPGAPEPSKGPTLPGFEK